ncbi:hypothetical protein [Aureivirga sp. CE67]|uniref:hypothetical protein n=1 Tax=Aureivirga sp. CE67 TaxID=1788983 RepID=UPI0018C95494|nr:hypothetical protein [Aureivirga sp. CE67]
MKKYLKSIILLGILIFIISCQEKTNFSQKEIKYKNLDNSSVQHFSLEKQKDTIDFIVVDSILTKKKPVLLYLQGSLPRPLFINFKDYGNWFFGGGISNFDLEKIQKEYHLVIISMPKTPVLVEEENLNNQYSYVPNPENKNKLSEAYLKNDYLENYVNRANSVLKFLEKQDWVDSSKLVVVGHSQGTKVGTKLALKNNKITHLGLLSPNPFGREDQFIREYRKQAENGEISWKKADEEIKKIYEISQNPELKNRLSFTQNYLNDWLELNIPIYIAYGTNDITSDLCDIVPLFFYQKGKENLTLKRHLELDHSFMKFENPKEPEQHMKEVINDFIDWTLK